MASIEPLLLTPVLNIAPACYRYNEISSDGINRRVYVSYPMKNGIYKERKQYIVIPDEPRVIMPRKPRTLKPEHLKKSLKPKHDPKYNDIASTCRRCFKQDLTKLDKFNLLTKDEQTRLVNLVLKEL